MRKLLMVVALVTFGAAQSHAACAPAALPPAVDMALSTVCSPSGKYVRLDQGGPAVEAATRSCQALRELKQRNEQEARACDAQTVPSGDQKIIDDALREAQKVKK